MKISIHIITKLHQEILIRKSVFFLILFTIASLQAAGQTISSSVPRKIVRSEKFLFYLHGGVVTVLGNNAINQSMPEWGPYEYLNILDSLRDRGFNVISENRKGNIEDAIYRKNLPCKLIHYLDQVCHRKTSWLLAHLPDGTLVFLHRRG